MIAKLVNLFKEAVNEKSFTVEEKIGEGTYEQLDVYSVVKEESVQVIKNDEIRFKVLFLVDVGAQQEAYLEQAKTMIKEVIANYPLSEG